MTIRSLLIIAGAFATAVIGSAIALGVYFFSAPAPPTQPGNYVFIAGGKCQLLAVRSDPSESVTIQASRCEPLTKNLSLAFGVVATTTQCGELQFVPAIVPTTFACPKCGISSPNGCPLLPLGASATTGWKLHD